MTDRRRLLIGAGVALVCVVSLLLVLPSIDVFESPLSAYGSDDDDVGDLVNHLRGEQVGFEVASLVLGPGALDSVDTQATDPVYLAVGVDRGYTESELDALLDFVQRGGTAIVLDDTGASLGLLERLNVTRGDTIFSTQPRNGTQSGESFNPSVVRVNIDGHPVNLWEPVELRVPMSDAPPQPGVPEITVIGEVTELAARDVDGNNEIDASDPTCTPSCVVAFRADHGTGRLFYIGDTTFATDRFVDVEGFALIASLAQAQEGGGRAMVIVDESRHILGPSEVGLTVFRTLQSPAQLDYLAWGLVAAALIVTLVSRQRQSRSDWATHDPGLDAPYQGIELPQEDAA